MPNDIILPLVRRLAEDHHVISWDSRWLPSLTHEFNAADCHSLTFARDLISVMNYFDLDKATIVGWSSGVQVALRAMHEFGDRINGAVLLNGGTSIASDTDEPLQSTDYQTNILSLLPKIKGNYRLAEMYCDLIYGTKLHSNNEADQGLFTKIMSSTDPYLLYMTSMPFRNADALYRYAHVMSNLLTEPGHAWTDGIKQPVLVYSGKKDTVTHQDAAVALGGRLANAQHVSDDEGDHFAHFYRRSVAEMVSGFAHEHSASSQSDGVDPLESKVLSWQLN